jgi:hypothetical protein
MSWMKSPLPDTMRPIFIELTLLSGIKTWLQVSQIVSITRIGKATYVRCVDDYPDITSTNTIRSVMEDPDYIFNALSALTHSAPNSPNNN